MSFAHIQDRISYGYGKAAKKLGKLYSIYRAVSGINPLSLSNLIGETYVSPNVSWDYMKANKSANTLWQLCVDARAVNTDDYLVGEDFTFFIDADQPLLPVNGYECNRIVRVTRPTKSLLPGENQYGGYKPDDVLEILLNAPISIILATGRPAANNFNLPLDAGLCRYNFYIPNLPNVDIRIGDLIDDDRGVRVVINGIEETSLGFRGTALSQEV